jgi:hypothetical protein
MPWRAVSKMEARREFVRLACPGRFGELRVPVCRTVREGRRKSPQKYFPGLQPRRPPAASSE